MPRWVGTVGGSSAHRSPEATGSHMSGAVALALAVIEDEADTSGCERSRS